MPTPEIINSTGLFLDIIGVVLLFRFGLPSTTADKRGSVLLSVGTDKETKKEWKRHHRISWLAMVLIVVGFILQIVSNHLT